VNFFEVFGLPKRLNIDLQALEKSFYKLSRKYHPDYFGAASEDDKAKALQMTALLNDAYRTLRQPIRRVEYLLNLEGCKPDGSKAPKSFLMEVFEINEQLEEFRHNGASSGQIATLRQQVAGKHRDLMARIDAASHAWDELLAGQAPDAEKVRHLKIMTELMSEFSYIRNLENDLEELQ